MLLLISSLVFVLTILAVLVLPFLDADYVASGHPSTLPPAFKQALNEHGWQWLLCEVAAIIVFGILSMVLDRIRSLKKERAAATIPPSDKK